MCNKTKGNPLYIATQGGSSERGRMQRGSLQVLLVGEGNPPIQGRGGTYQAD